ncbi:hypothetical protein Tco_1228657 [Tanacetum coccineum]
MSENEDKYHDTVLDLKARAKENEDVVLKIGNSLQGMFMLGPKPMSFYNSKVKHGLGYTNPYTLKKAISQNLKLYDASCLDDSKIHMNVRDTEDILDDATNNIKEMKDVFESTKNDLSETWKQNKLLKDQLLEANLKHELLIDAVTPLSAKNKVVQIILWIVDSGCSKHMTGDRSLLEIFVEKFMGTDRFGNYHFAAITCYDDYEQGNITVCKVAFRSNTFYVRNLEGDDLLTGARESNLYTISFSDMAASSPI